MTYEEQVLTELEQWKAKLRKRSGFVSRLAKKSQTKLNALIPVKAHQVMTESIKALVKTVLFGSKFLTKTRDVEHLSLEERDDLVHQTLKTYKKLAMAEGAGTGAGGILLGLADFPLLLTIKMKFLFEAASQYGYDVQDYDERLFILHVFQLAFSSDKRRAQTLDIIEHWEERKQQLHDVDWQVFQQEYRDYIDVAKMLQLVPGIGAVVGAYANYNLLDHLGEVAMNAYRMRILEQVGAHG